MLVSKVTLYTKKANLTIGILTQRNVDNSNKEYVDKKKNKKQKKTTKFGAVSFCHNIAVVPPNNELIAVHKIAGIIDFFLRAGNFSQITRAHLRDGVGAGRRGEERRGIEQKR
jgi:hypothetical protein